jgi:hypothetical protein
MIVRASAAARGFSEKILKSSEKYITNCTLQETLIISWRSDEVSDNT